MKKLKDRHRFIILSEKRFRKRLKRKRHINYLKKMSLKNQSSYADTQKNRAKLRRKINKNKLFKIAPPDNFSIINNPNPSILFFEELQKHMLRLDPVFVEMKNISQITVDALVYYIAVLQKLKSKLTLYLLRGSFPEDKKTLNLMTRSGFLKYFQTAENNIKIHDDFIEIKSGNIADNQIVKSICLFVMKKLDVGRIGTQKLYDIIFEMMLNTKHHAYSVQNRNYDNWLLFLRFSPEKKSIKFIFMDTGYGIPNTVRQNKLEIAKKWFSQFGVTDFNENDLVYSALNGAYRTQTKEGYRGKGLPRINKAFKDGYINNLSILSSRACIKSNERYDLESKMIGTLFFWTITRESINAKN